MEYLFTQDNPSVQSTVINGVLLTKLKTDNKIKYIIPVLKQKMH